MKHETTISPAILRMWESYLPRSTKSIPADEKLRYLLKIAFANITPPVNTRSLIFQKLQGEDRTSPSRVV